MIRYHQALKAYAGFLRVRGEGIFSTQPQYVYSVRILNLPNYLLLLEIQNSAFQMLLQFNQIYPGLKSLPVIRKKVQTKCVTALVRDAKISYRG